MKKDSIYMFILSTVLLSACVKDDVCKTTHPMLGAVTVTTDWTNHSSDAILPDQYIVEIGEKNETVTRATHSFSSLFEEGVYLLLAYNIPQGMTVTNGMVQLNSQPDSTLEPLSAYLFTGTMGITVMPDDTLRTILPMKQRTHLLVLSLALDKGDETHIASVDALLTGIASVLELKTGLLPPQTGKNVKPAFRISFPVSIFSIHSTRAVVPAILTAPLRLLGVVSGEKQLLTLLVSLTDGRRQIIETDLTELLKDFGTNNTPLELNARLNLNVDGGFSAAITGWQATNGGGINVN